MFRSRDKPKNYIAGGYSFPFGGTSAGKTVNERTAMQTTAVYACVRVLAEAIAGLPLHVYRDTGGAGKECVSDHPLAFLLGKEPNPEMTSFVFRETLMSHLLLWGNAFAQVIRDGRGHVTALYPLLPSKMDVNRVGGELVYTYLSDHGVVKLRRENVLHIPGLGFDGLTGYSPIALAKNAIGMALATEDYGARFFANGANPGGVLEHPGVVKDRDGLRESWQAQFSGANAHKIAVLEEGLKFHQMSIPPEDAQFLETRRFQIEEIARIFRVPLHLLGDLEHATFSNVEHLSLDFVKFSLEPWVTRWEQSMQQTLLLPGEKRDLYVKFTMDGLLRGDYQSRMQGYSVGIQNGFMSPDDVRALEDLNPIPGGFGAKYYFNGNMLPIELAGQQYGATQSKEETQ
jgi:HK97 family phage portal protein